MSVRTLMLAGSPNGKGPYLLGRRLLNGNSEIGWYGLYQQSDSIGVAALREATGQSAGTLQTNSGNIPWMGFSFNGKRLLIAQRSIVTGVSWNHLNGLGLVSGTKQVEINGKLFKVRLIDGGSVVGDSECEWDRLMYRVSEQPTPGVEKWEEYTNAELNVGVGNGRSCLTMANNPNNPNQCVRRGIANVLDFDYSDKTYSAAPVGWRPVLELIE